MDTKRPNRYGTNAHLQWSRAVMERDGYKCVRCGSSKLLDAHHKIAWTLGSALNLDVANGETLCSPCHARHHISGTTQSNEHVQRRVESKRGYAHSAETRRKIGIANTGRKRSDDANRKASDSTRGRAWSQARWDAQKAKYPHRYPQEGAS